jgi:hypothetical protein
VKAEGSKQKVQTRKKLFSSFSPDRFGREKIVSRLKVLNYPCLLACSFSKPKDKLAKNQKIFF